MKNGRNYTHLLSIFCLCIFITHSQLVAGQAFIWGINGHSISERSPYENSLSTQLKQVKNLGLSYYRNDISVSTSGKVNNQSRFDNLLSLAKQYKIKILPMIYDKWDPQLSNEQNYDTGYAIGLNFSKRYGKQIPVMEISNERDASVIQSNLKTNSKIPADGQLTSHYNLNQLKSLAESLRGMANGIHKANPNVKVIVNCSNHPRWGYFAALKQYGVKYDIIGVHWYTSSGSIRNIYGQDGLKMFSQYKKPIWITEINRGGGSYGEQGNDTEAEALRSLVKEIRPYSNVKAFFIYELYDSPNEKLKNNAEGFFGIYSNPNTGKKAAVALKSITAQNK